MKFTDSYSAIFFGVVLPISNFYLWFRIAQHHNQETACEKGIDSFLANMEGLSDLDLCEDDDKEIKLNRRSHVDERTCSPYILEEYETPDIELVPTSEFDQYRAGRLAPINFPGGVLRFYHPTDSRTVIVRQKEECRSIYTQFFHDKPHTCYAVVRISNVNASFNMLRFDADFGETGLSKIKPDKYVLEERALDPSSQFVPNIHNKELPRATGYFRAVPRDRGRFRMYDKLGPYVRRFNGPDGIEQQLDDLLKSRGLKSGDDVVVMVTNQGETDLFMNFACSCQQNGLSLHNMLVFCGDK
jgi:hypothetical protein